MSAQENLVSLYQQWKKWTEDEGSAIQAGTWPQVSLCQNAKSNLQQEIIVQSEALNAEIDTGGLDRPLIESQLRGHIAELIRLELRNGDLLAAQGKNLRTRTQELNRNSHSLRQVHRAYCSAPPIHWHSYS
jgi:hypothetical protein